MKFDDSVDWCVGSGVGRDVGAGFDRGIVV